jgi:hypothetical protein
MKSLAVCCLARLFSGPAHAAPGRVDSAGRHVLSDRRQRLSHWLRTGQYADARRLIDQMLAEKQSDDLKNVRAVLGGGLTCSRGLSATIMPAASLAWTFSAKRRT